MSDTAAHLVIDRAYVVEAFLDLPTEQFKFLPAELATVQEFDSHTNQTHKSGAVFLAFSSTARPAIDVCDMRAGPRATRQSIATAIV